MQKFFYAKSFQISISFIIIIMCVCVCVCVCAFTVSLINKYILLLTMEHYTHKTKLLGITYYQTLQHWNLITKNTNL